MKEGEKYFDKYFYSLARLYSFRLSMLCSSHIVKQYRNGNLNIPGNGPLWDGDRYL